MVNTVWVELLRTILNIGADVRPREYLTKELLAWPTLVPMVQPILTITARELGYRFLMAEAAWILSGDNRVSSIRPYSRAISSFSDDGLTFRGAYGPKFIDQEPFIVETLRRDPASRQAVLTLWRERPAESRDIPCTLSLQFVLREDRLNTIATMRSSDAWLGWPYDVHSFSMMTAHVLLSLRQRESMWQTVGLGRLFLTAGSQHLYQRHWEAAKSIVENPASSPPFAPFIVSEFVHPDELTEHLWSAARETN